MPYSSKAIANFFLKSGAREQIEISPMKLQKLIYYAHGFNLAFDGVPLINEQIECWRYGPVIPSIFYEFKEFGSSPITRKATRIKGGRRIIPVVPASDAATHATLSAVWSAYKNFSAVKLSNMTHRKGEAWRVVFDKFNGNPPRGTDIPEETIRECFGKMVEISR